MPEALDAWLEAKGALEGSMPWTAEWLRLRMIEQDRRAAYLALMDPGGGAVDEIGAEDEIRVEDEVRVDARPLRASVARPEGFEPPTY
ncbi:MAG TPA: hypothetical protein VK867_02420 [Candidatus Limnocylindrales bacterium]|nr:hypothetical protein [Candidatus Limnocylindrales bacterium]